MGFSHGIQVDEVHVHLRRSEFLDRAFRRVALVQNGLKRIDAVQDGLLARIVQGGAGFSVFRAMLMVDLHLRCSWPLFGLVAALLGVVSVASSRNVDQRRRDSIATSMPFSSRKAWRFSPLSWTASTTSRPRVLTGHAGHQAEEAWKRPSTSAVAVEGLPANLANPRFLRSSFRGHVGREIAPCTLPRSLARQGSPREPANLTSQEGFSFFVAAPQPCVASSPALAALWPSPRCCGARRRALRRRGHRGAGCAARHDVRPGGEAVAGR